MFIFKFQVLNNHYKYYYRKKNIIGMAKNSPDEVAHQSSHQEWPNVSFSFKKFSML